MQIYKNSLLDLFNHVSSLHVFLFMRSLLFIIVYYRCIFLIKNVKNIYFFHQNQSSRFQEKPLLKFFFPLHNSQKHEFLGLSLGEILLHMDANLRQKFQINTRGVRFCMLIRLCPLV